MRLQFMSELITLFDSKDDFIIGYSSQLIKQIRNYLNRLLCIIYVGTTLKKYHFSQSSRLFAIGDFISILFILKCVLENSMSFLF